MYTFFCKAISAVTPILQDLSILILSDRQYKAPLIALTPDTLKRHETDMLSAVLTSIS